MFKRSIEGQESKPQKTARINIRKKLREKYCCFNPLKLFNQANISQLPRFSSDSKILIFIFQTPHSSVCFLLNSDLSKHRKELFNILNRLTFNVVNTKCPKYKGQFIKMSIFADLTSFLLSLSFSTGPDFFLYWRSNYE